MEEVLKTLVDKLNIGRVTANISPFNLYDIRWWFTQTEVQFDISRYVIANLPSFQLN